MGRIQPTQISWVEFVGRNLPKNIGLNLILPMSFYPKNMGRIHSTQVSWVEFVGRNLPKLYGLSCTSTHFFNP